MTNLFNNSSLEAFHPQRLTEFFHLQCLLAEILYFFGCRLSSIPSEAGIDKEQYQMRSYGSPLPRQLCPVQGHPARHQRQTEPCLCRSAQSHFSFQTRQDGTRTEIDSSLPTLCSEWAYWAYCESCKQENLWVFPSAGTRSTP